MRKKKLLAALIVIFAFGVAYPVIAPAQASAYLHVQNAAGKAATNTWNRFCHSSYNVCSYYPYWDGWSRRINANTVDIGIRVYKWGSGSCWSYRRVKGDDWNMWVDEWNSGQYWCS